MPSSASCARACPACTSAPWTARRCAASAARMQRPAYVTHARRQSLERSLKRACEAFILHATGDLVGPLLSLLGDHSAPGGAEGAVSPGPCHLPPSVRRPCTYSPPTGTDRAVAALEGVQERIGGRLRAIAYSMVVYLASDSTQDVLFRPIRVRTGPCRAPLWAAFRSPSFTRRRATCTRPSAASGGRWTRRPARRRWRRWKQRQPRWGPRSMARVWSCCTAPMRQSRQTCRAGEASEVPAGSSLSLPREAAVPVVERRAGGLGPMRGAGGAPLRVLVRQADGGGEGVEERVPPRSVRLVRRGSS